MSCSRPDPCRRVLCRRTGPRRQRGVAALATTLLLLGVLALAIADTGRRALVEHKAAANQQRAAQALAAAEAGLDWTVAMLAAGRTVGDDCVAAAGPTTLRERLLRHDPDTDRLVPRIQASPGGGELPLRLACVATGTGGWSCRCAASGGSLPPLPDAEDPAARPGFSVVLEPLLRAGSVRLAAIGCDHATRACLQGGPDGGEAVARVQVALALLPAVATPPVGALTARGAVAGGPALVLSSTDPSAGGIALHAGGTHAPGATLHSVPGAPASVAAVEGDAALSSLGDDAMFASVLGIEPRRWLRLPGMLKVKCPDGCDAAMGAALNGTAAPTFIHVAGDLRLSQPLTVGSPTRPVVLVVDGEVQLAAGVVVHGLVWIGAPVWDTTGSTGGLVRGAVVARGSVRGNGALEVFRDAAVLARLHRSAGVLVPVPGSWRDF